MSQVNPTSRPGPMPDCPTCLAGALLSFSWDFAQKQSISLTAAPAFAMPNVAAFTSPEPLRQGTLYRCRACNRCWHLDAAKRMMSHVLEARVPLIRAWSREAIMLSQVFRSQLESIGPTPSDIYGNGREYVETPCSVVTKDGERIDIAVLSNQTHAPFEQSRRYRLGSEIAEIYSSPFALPLDVRVATSQAQELRMGFAPTLVETEDHRLFILNWRESFFVKDGCDPTRVKVSPRGVDLSQMPEIVAPPAEITYFVADG